MAVIVKEPTNVEQYIDEQGRLTVDGMRLFQQMIRQLKDHEARIVILEP